MDTTAAIKWKPKLRKVFVLQYNIELCDCTVGNAFPTKALSIQSFLCFINVLSIGSNSVRGSHDRFLKAFSLHALLVRTSVHAVRFISLKSWADGS